MIFDRIPVSLYATNCYIVGCGDTLQGVVFDPGGDGPEIIERINRHGIKVKYIVITHGHFDHIGALKEVRDHTGAQVAVHKDDRDMLLSPQKSLSILAGSKGERVEPDLILEDGSELKVGKLTLKVIHTPGHTPGGISVIIDNHLLISGDTLFAGSIGRTDFPGGDYNTLINSIKTKLIPLGDDIKVYPGHGPATTIGTEKVRNPFLK